MLLLPDPGDGYPWQPGHEHIWYSFWDANLGRPSVPKPKTTKNIEDYLYREFTNGWAVYNRSGKAPNHHAGPPLLPPSPIGEITLRPKPTFSLTSTVKSISRAEVSLMSMVMGRSMSWIWFRLPMDSVNPPLTPMAMGRSTSWIWCLSPSNSVNKITLFYLFIP